MARQSRQQAKQHVFDKRLSEYVRKLQSQGLSGNQIAERIFQRFGQIVHRVSESEIVMRGIKGSEYVVSLRNPSKQHLPKASAKEQRQYEHILSSEMKRGRTKKTAKRIAAATVRKGHRNPSQVYLVRKNKLKGWDVVRVQGNTLVTEQAQIATKKEAETIQFRLQAHNPARDKGKKALRKTGRAVKGAARSLLSAGSKILGAGASALNPSKVFRVTARNWHTGARKDFGNYRANNSSDAIRQAKKDAQLRSPSVRYADWKATVLNPKRKNKTIIKARTIKHLDVSKVHNPRKKNAYRIPPEAIKKFPQHMQDEYWKHWGDLEKKEEKATTPKQKQAVAKAKRSFLSRLGTRLKVIGQTKKYKVSARNLNKAPRKVIKVKARHETDALAKAKSKLGSGFDQLRVQNVTRHRAGNPTYTVSARTKPRKRNLDHRDLSHQVKVHQHWRAGGLSQWQRAHHAGQQGLFAHGIKAKPKRNKANPMEIGGGRQTIKDAPDWYVYKVEDAYGRHYYVIKKGEPGNSPLNRRFSSKRDALEYFKKKASQNPKNRRRNTSPDAIRKDFAGRVGKGTDLYFPEGTPQGLAKLGKLVSITTEEGTLKPTNGTAWLVCDTNGKLHIGTTANKPLWSGSAHSFGSVKQVEYQESKPHLGFPNPIVFYHKLGEENGRKPKLYADGKGGLKFKGGAYRITREGIVN